MSDFLVWPVTIAIVLLILGITFLVMFRRSISETIPKLKWAFGGGTASPQEQAPVQQVPVPEPAEDAPAAPLVLSPYVREVIEGTRSAVASDAADAPTREQRLLVLAAMGQISAQFERVYHQLRLSQLLALRHINGVPRTDRSALQGFHDRGQADLPPIFHITFDEWVGFLVQSILIRVEQDGTFQITVRGREFLGYLVEAGRPDPAIL